MMLRFGRRAALLTQCLIVLALAWPAGRGRAEGARKPLVALVSIDGFRPDYLNRGHSPTLDRLAADGAVAQGLRPSFPSSTFPNHYTLVTGLTPDHHGIVNNTMFDPTIPGRPFSLAFRDVITNSAWWNDGIPVWETLKRSGKRVSTLFWPGSEAPIHGVQPDDWLPYDDAMTSAARVDKLLSWLDRPDDARADFATLYFSEVDTAGHVFGPSAPETAEAVKRVDAALKNFLEGLQVRGLGSVTDLVIVSDHGMATVPAGQVIDLKALLGDIAGVRVQWNGPVGGVAVPTEEQQNALTRLAASSNMTCWRKSEIPPHLKLGTHQRVPDILCLAQPGWTTTDNPERPQVIGQHGYDPREPDMLGLLILNGPRLKEAKLGIVDNLDIYPLLCRLTGITPEKHDGTDALADTVVVQ